MNGGGLESLVLFRLSIKIETPLEKEGGEETKHFQASGCELGGVRRRASIEAAKAKGGEKLTAKLEIVLERSCSSLAFCSLAAVKVQGSRNEASMGKCLELGSSISPITKREICVIVRIYTMAKCMIKFIYQHFGLFG